MGNLHLKLFYFCFLLFTSINTFAYDAKINGIYYILSGDEAQVTYQKYKDYRYVSDYTGTVVIPAYITYNSKTYSVTTIGDFAFCGCIGLTSVIIPNSVTSIGASAFGGCIGLTSVNIPNSVTYIGSIAFSGCYFISSTFINNTMLTSETNWGATLCDEEASDGLLIKNNVVVICRPWATDVTISNSVTSIGDYAFYECTGLVSVTLNSNAIVSASRTYSASMKSIFGDQVKTYILGEDVKSIGDCAFGGCSDLTSVTIPNSVTTIGKEAFGGCSSLTCITIPNSVTSIGDYVFVGCSSLTCITIPNSVTSIGVRTFYGCSGLTSITIPNSVTSIGGDAFSGCSSLTSIIIPNGVTSISDYTFYGCTGLTSVTIPDSVTRIGNYAFYECSSLTSIAIPNSVTHIGQCAFYSCTSLTSVTIPNSVIWTGGALFIGCSNLTSVTIDSNAMMSDINNGMKSVFGNQVKEYIIGDAVTNIGYAAFSGCSGLTIVTIPKSVKSIDAYAFEGCIGLTSVTIGNSVKSIGFRTFYFYTSLASVTIPNSVKTIDACAFEGCIGLTEVYCLAENVPKTPSNTFSQSSISSATLYVLSDSMESYKAVSPWKEFGTIVGITQDMIDGIKDIGPSTLNIEEVWYSLDGKRLDKPQRGLNIFHSSNGITRKVFIKYGN